MGFEGANVIFDTWVHPLMMGLEEHLLQMFREDFEFNNDTIPSHLAAHQPNVSRPDEVTAVASPAPCADAPKITQPASSISWAVDAEQELKRIPFFVRGKARQNTETFAKDNGIACITLETLYDAKAHFGR